MIKTCGACLCMTMVQSLPGDERTASEPANVTILTDTMLS
jgi:hypothetical protein